MSYNANPTRILRKANGISRPVTSVHDASNHARYKCRPCDRAFETARKLLNHQIARHNMRFLNQNQCNPVKSHAE